jgi:hypothetical protein
MVTVTLDMFSNTLKLLKLNQDGKAKPIGPAGGNVQWVATDTKQKVVEIGVLLKKDVKL